VADAVSTLPIVLRAGLVADALSALLYECLAGRPPFESARFGPLL
jgi:hypothetical protein